MPGWILIALGYFFGCIPTAYLAGRLVKGKDIRRLGDYNAGAANAYRELGPAAGIAIFTLDAAKGAAVILIAQAAHPSPAVVLLAGAAAVAGHNWPVFLGFRGGRGVSTTIGILYVLVTIPALIITLPVLLVIYFTRGTTPGLAFLFITLPFLNWWMGIPGGVIAYGVGLSALTGITTFFRIRGKALREIGNSTAD